MPAPVRAEIPRAEIPRAEIARADLVRAAQELAPEISAQADEIERAGRLPDTIADRFAAAGLYSLYLPANGGGPECDPISAMTAIEVLARADASAGWCAHVSSANAWALATLHPDTLAAMSTAAEGRWSMSGSARPLGRARPVPGGYQVSGRWDFASNCLHASWYSGTCVVEQANGKVRNRTLIMPITDGTIIDTWQVTGMRGTGSHDFEVTDVFVPDERVGIGRNLAHQQGPLYRPRLTMVVTWALTAAVALGNARGALDTFRELANQTTAERTEVPLRDRGEVQQAVGRAEAMISAARSYCYHGVADAWHAMSLPDASDTANPADPADPANPAELDRLVLDARLSIPHAMHTAVAAIDLLFSAGGTRSIYHRNHLERRFRDAHTALRHVAGSTQHFIAGGRLSLGVPVGAPFW
ncbi:MAG: acyl-CoA dehydrogenase family protein [Acidimicrobiales bacterium]